jgi:DNA-binding response OmpR family regulator
MARGILLVDDHADVRNLIHSALDSLRNPQIEIEEAASAEEAAEKFARRPADLLVLDYQLPEEAAIELLHHVRAAQPNIQIILITDKPDRKRRDEMRNAGAAAVFEKPIPLGDFLDAAERGLGLRRTIFPAATEPAVEAGRVRVSDLLANLRQDVQADAVMLISDRGLVVARAGDLRDSSMEVSLMSTLSAVFSASIKVARSVRQETNNPFTVFVGGDQDLILMAVNTRYALLLAASGLSSQTLLARALQAMQAVRIELEKALRSLGAAAEGLVRGQRKSPPAEQVGEAPEIAELLQSADGKSVKPEELDRFWEQAAATSANGTTIPGAISYEEARKMGLTPDKE